MKNPELPVVDIEAQQPISADYEDRMIDHGLTPSYLDGVNSHQSSHIRSQLSTVELALALTRDSRESESMIDETPVDQHAQKRYEMTRLIPGGGLEEKVFTPEEFVAMYKNASKNGVRKLDTDAEIVLGLLCSLGPTNALETEAGHDAGIDLGIMIHLLETDYYSIPESRRRPAMREVEAQLRQELALLWSAPAMSRARSAGADSAGHMFHLEDPNIFTPEQIESLPESERWKMIGVRLAEESASLYEAIYSDESATEDQRAEAICRMTDMRTRALLIRRSMKGPDRISRDVCDAQIVDLNEAFGDYLLQIESRRYHNGGVRGIPNGKFFELLSVYEERKKSMLKDGELVRLSTVREDMVHPSSPHYVTRGDAPKELKLSHDIVVENVSGRVMRRLQVKAMTEEDYERIVSAKRLKPDYMAEMRFYDAEHDEAMSVPH